MDLRIEDDGEILLVAVRGVDSLDASNSLTLRSELEKKVRKGRAVILSMAAVQSIDSSGIGALVAVLKEIRKQGERFALIDVNPQVYSVLDMIRLTTVFEILPDEAAARAAIASHLA
jgi:anti-sigma B factor antagonist